MARLIYDKFSKQENAKKKPHIWFNMEPMDQFYREGLSAIGERLEVLRIAYAYHTKEAMAQAIGVSPQRWSSYLRGISLIPVPVATRLCRRYKVDLNWIYHGDMGGLSDPIRAKIEAAERATEGHRKA